jgi:hypothetical protein
MSVLSLSSIVEERKKRIYATHQNCIPGISCLFSALLFLLSLAERNCRLDRSITENITWSALTLLLPGRGHGHLYQK